MPLDYRNINTLWTSILVETLQRLGLTTAIICPGSRSTPLTVAFAQHPKIEAIPVLDERSASFFALGIAKRSRLPVALVCTSGTAGANFYPAVIEGRESRVPLLILTADRPPLLRHCHAGQTIDQVKLYGHYPNWQLELALPAPEMKMLCYLRQNIIQAWERSLFPAKGPVHINLPFTEPLAPIEQGRVGEGLKGRESEFFAAVTSYQQLPVTSPAHAKPGLSRQLPVPSWGQEERGVIIAGLGQSLGNPRGYCEAIAQLSQFLGWPVLAEALSPVRNYRYLNPYLISTYDAILRNRELAAKLVPEMVIQIGELPTSKVLRRWLTDTQPKRWIVDPTPENLDPLHGQTIHLRTSVETLGGFIPAVWQELTSQYLSLWCGVERETRRTMDEKMKSMKPLFPGKVPWLLSQTLPPGTPIFIANSMSVRHAEFFWSPGDRSIVPYFNRGVNGIDGTLSTALGIAHDSHLPNVIITGDLALLHDTNGFLLGQHFRGHLTIILLNNHGGGIFEMLPISDFDPPFEEYFATPQEMDFAQLCYTYGIQYELISNWQQLEELLNPLPETGMRLLELQTNRKEDAQWLQAFLEQDW